MRIELRDELVKSPTGNGADDFAPYLDTFLLDGAKDPLGAVLVLPGGGYNHRAYHEGDPVARKFNELGYHAFGLQYRVAPYVAPAPQQDVLRAVKLIRSRAAEWGVGKLAVLGFSAGAHLAACSALVESDGEDRDGIDRLSGRPDALVLCYPVIALTEPFGNRGSGVNLVGGDYPEKMRRYDLHKLVDGDTPPTFIWHTAEDAAVPVRNSLVFAEAMWRSGAVCELHVFPHGPHGRGLGYGRDLRQWPVLTAEFLANSAGFVRA